MDKFIYPCFDAHTRDEEGVLRKCFKYKTERLEFAGIDVFVSSSLFFRRSVHPMQVQLILIRMLHRPDTLASLRVGVNCHQIPCLHVCVGGWLALWKENGERSRT